MADSTQTPATNQAQQPAEPQGDQAPKEVDEIAEATKQQIHQDLTASQPLGTTQEMQDTVVDIEKELLKQIINRLDENKMTPEEAKKLAQEFLSLLPIKDQHDLLGKLLKLSQDNNATKGIYLKYAEPIEETERLRKLELMSQHIHQGNIEHAIAVAKGGTTNG